MEPARRRSTRSKGGRRQSIFRSLDDYERHMQRSVETEDGAYYDDLPHDARAGSARIDDTEPVDVD